MKRLVVAPGAMIGKQIIHGMRMTKEDIIAVLLLKLVNKGVIQV